MKARANNIVPIEYAGQSVQFDRDGWFNATVAAARFGKNPAEWLRLPTTRQYLAGLERKYGKIPHLKARRGNNGGTWLHPKLAVRFAQWLDIDFAIWCDEQIDSLIRGTHPQFDQERLRREAAASFRVMTEILRLTRERAGKAAEARHFINEAKLVTWALTGSFGALDRSALTSAHLALLVQIEERNAVMLGAGVEYAARKRALELYAAEHRLIDTETPTFARLAGGTA